METAKMVQGLSGWRAEVGMLAPLPGMYREWDFVAPEGVRFSTAIMGLGDVNPENLKKMAEAVEVEAKKLNMSQKKDLLCFGCTSGSFVGGPGYDQTLIERIEKASGSPATTTITSVLEILKDLGIKKIAMAGPYIDPILDIEVKFFKSHGIKVLSVKGLQLLKTTQYWDYYMSPYQAYKVGKEAAKAAPGADCLFITCMMTTILGVADQLEQEIGMPVISSPSATLYNILKKLGIPDPVSNYGEALKRPRVTKAK